MLVYVKAVAECIELLVCCYGQDIMKRNVV